MRQSIPSSAFPTADVSWRDTKYVVAVPHFESDYIQGALMQSGRPYEEEMLAALAAEVAPDDLVLDIGANIGNHTLFLACVAGARVIAYEPNPELAAALVESVRIGGLEGRVTVLQHAIGAAPARGRLDRLNEANLGAQSVTEDPEGAFEIVRLDDEMPADRVRAMKIDVEGMELEVLMGSEALISRDKPLLYIECIDRFQFDAVEEWLASRGYSLSDTFNATPTHLFRDASGQDASDLQALRRSVHTRYQLEGRLANLTAQLRRSEARDEMRNAELKGVKADLQRSTLDFQDCHHEVTIMKKRLDQAQAHLIANQSRLHALESSRSVRLSRAIRDYDGTLRGVTDLAGDMIRIFRSKSS